MTLEGLDCWDDYPMEHGCICGNDCAPPPLRPDPEPYVWRGTKLRTRVKHDGEAVDFAPRPDYSQNREDYPA